MQLLLTVLFCTSWVHADDLRQVLVVSGMSGEGKIAAGTNVVSILSGGDPVVLETSLKNIDPSTLRAVVSFGVAGGLAAPLNPADVVIANSVTDAGGAIYPVDARLLQQIEASLQAHNIIFHEGADYGSATEILDASAKQAMGAQTNTQSVDMESQVAAAWAQANHLPFAMLRTISDPQSLTVPAIASQALNPDGSINYGAVIGDLQQHPGDLGPLLEVSKDTQAALKVLQTCRNAVDLGTL
jgi:adenosylhomocysteine nucleosidase